MRLNTKESVRRMLKKPSGSSKKDENWGLIEERYQEGLELRRPFEQRWIINLAFYAGRQYTFFNTSAWMLQQIRHVKGRIRNVDNKIMPKVRRQIAEAIRNDPVMSCVPNTNDDEDIRAAKVGDKVLRSLWQQLSMKRKHRMLRSWIHTCGNGFLSDRWDPKRGPTKVDPKKGELVYLGDVAVDVWSPFEILVPFTSLGQDDLQDFPWLVAHKYRTLEWIKENYARGDEVSSEALPDQHFDAGTIFGMGGSASRMKSEGAVVKDLYVLPCASFPRGKFLVGANGIVLEESDYPFDDFPFEHFVDLPIPGVFWGMATMENAISLQKTWNRTVSSIDEFNRTMGKGKGLVPRGARLEAMPDDTHGEWIEYTPVMGHKPEHMRPGTLPRTYELALQITGASLEDLFSQHEVSRGTNRSDIRSGDMVELLLEQDAMGQLPSHASFEESLERLMARVLKRVQKGYSEQRMLRVTGREGEFDVFAFKGADLKNNTDVSVKRESSLPASRAARNLEVRQRFTQGLYGNPADPEVRRHVMNMLDDAIVEDIYSDTKLDEANARAENFTMIQGGITRLLVNEYDNHALHVKEHNHFRKSRDFQKMRLENPSAFAAIELIFTDHVRMHMAFLAEARRARLREMALMQGGKRTNGATATRTGGQTANRTAQNASR